MEEEEKEEERWRRKKRRRGGVGEACVSSQLTSHFNQFCVNTKRFIISRAAESVAMLMTPIKTL